jgi:hypothetical protein
MEANYTNAAAQLRYYPEWIVAGDGLTDSGFGQQGYGGSHGQDAEVWSHAVVISPQPQVPLSNRDRLCFQAQRSVDPNVPTQDAGSTGCDRYPSLRQLFIGIQVAGPRLGPTSIDKGFHAIPAISSPSLEIPACFYLPGDYTCIKDFIIGKWDPNAYPGDPQPGCYKIAGARRLIGEDIVPRDPLSEYRASDPCNNYSTSLQQNLGPPDPDDL